MAVAVAVLHCRTLWWSNLTYLLVQNMLMCISGMASAMEMVGLLCWNTDNDMHLTECHVAKHERMWLQVQVILIHWFSVITVLKSSFEMLWIVLHYLLFLLKEQILFTSASSLIRNLLFEICQLIRCWFRRNWNARELCSDFVLIVFIVLISYIVFHNESPLCWTVLDIHEQKPQFLSIKSLCVALCLYSWSIVTACVEHSIWNSILWDDAADCYCCDKPGGLWLILQLIRLLNVGVPLSTGFSLYVTFIQHHVNIQHHDC